RSLELSSSPIALSLTRADCGLRWQPIQEAIIQPVGSDHSQLRRIWLSVQHRASGVASRDDSRQANQPQAQPITFFKIIGANLNGHRISEQLRSRNQRRSARLSFVLKRK